MRFKSGTSYGCFIIAVAISFMAATATNAAAAKCPSPSSPNEIDQYLVWLVDDVPPPCPDKWIERNDPSFSAWENGGSYNLPVVAAAVGLYRFRNGIMAVKNPTAGSYKITYVNWWIWYLASQTGRDPKAYLPDPFVPPPARPNLPYFKGSELLSNLYDAPVVTSIVAVHYWAHRYQNNPAVVDPGKAQQLIRSARSANE